MTMPAGFTPDEFEFAENSGNSSQDNFLQWLVENIEPLRKRFGWGDDEAETVAELLWKARENAIDDLTSTLADMRGMEAEEAD